MSDMHNTAASDIEIYVKDVAFHDIVSWLTSVFDKVDVLKQGKAVHDLSASLQGRRIHIMIVENAIGKAWSSIWFKEEVKSWRNDVDCAKDINAKLHCYVRCNSGLWREGAEMDEWLQLDEQGNEQSIKWPNAG